jgi:hypothetical protein
MVLREADMRHLVILFAVVAIVAASALAYAQSAFSHQALTISTAVVKIADTTRRPSTAVYATWCSGTLEGGPIRYMYHGETPTAITGEPLIVGERITIAGQNNIARFRAIRSAAVDGVVRFTCGN